jgi:serine O-acetyltransferase
VKIAVGYDPSGHGCARAHEADGASHLAFRVRRQPMSREHLADLRHTLTKLWLFSPERLWLLSISLNRRGHLRLAFAVKQLNSILYHNSLAPGASVSPDVLLGHFSHGTVIHSNVVIGRRVKIWHNVTLAVPPAPGPPAHIVIEDDVKIGTNAVVIAPPARDLHVGRGARIGAGAVVTRDVPARATVVPAPARVLVRPADGTVSNAEEALVDRPDEPGAAGDDSTAETLL